MVPLLFFFFIGGYGGCGSDATPVNDEAVAIEIEGEDEPDTTPPSVLSITPDRDAVDIELDQVISATFDEAIDAVTVSASSFIVEDETGTPIEGLVSYDDATWTIMFEPVQELARGMTYTAMLSNSITDSAGVSLSDEYAWSFTTDRSFYVSVEGDDADRGTKNHPWKTIRHAVAEVSEGNTIRVMAGTYSEDAPIIIDKSIDLIGEDRDRTIILPPATFGGSFEDETIIGIVGSDDNLPENINVGISGFWIRAEETPGLRFAILLRGGAYAEIKDNVVTGAMRSVGEVNSGNITVGWNDFGFKARALIDGNIITDFHSFGIAVYGAGNEATISNNVITGNPAMHICSSNPGNWAGAMGIVVQSNDAATIEGNDISNMRKNPSCAPACYDSGIELYSAGDLVVSGNMLDDNDYGFASYAGFPSGNLIMNNNEIVNNDVGAQLLGVTVDSFVDNVFSGNITDTIP